MEAHRHHPQDEGGEETALLLRNPPGHTSSLDQQPTHFDESHAAPRQQYAYIAAQGSARIHAGNSYVEQQHNYYGTEATPQNPASNRLCLKTALAFPEMSLRSANIATAQSQTCDWIFETPEYKRWLDPTCRLAHHGILWIKGKPGAGKSTIMKHILRTSQKKGDTRKLISFFFNARGQGLVRSTEGMFRTLLCQLIESVPAVQGMVDPDSISIFKDQGWPLELLKDLFREAVRQYRYDGSLTCCIDALDECDEDEIRNMLVLFEDLGEMATLEELPFFVCFTSRHYPNISITHTEHIVIDDLREHQDDISKYVQRRLNICVATALKEELATEIRRKSSGVFLWVVLVVNLLNKTKDQGNTHLLHDRLSELPASLHALFDNILERDKPDANFLPIIQWTLYARRALTAPELYSAVMVSTNRLTETTIKWNADLVNEQVLRDFITTSSKGFLEIAVVSDILRRRSLFRIWPLANLSVQFIHESVREYFLDYGLQRLDPALSAVGEEAQAAIQQRLARWALSYMELSLAQHLSSVGSLQAASSDSVLNLHGTHSSQFLEYVLTDGAYCRPYCSRLVRASNNGFVHQHVENPRRMKLIGETFGACDMDTFPSRSSFRVKLHLRAISALECLLQHGRDIPTGIAHCEIDRHAYHVTQLKIICVLLAECFHDCDSGSPPRHECAVFLQALIDRQPEEYVWNLSAQQLSERLIAAVEIEMPLLVHVTVVAMATRGTLADVPLVKICTLLQKMLLSVARRVKEALILGLSFYFPEKEFYSSEYENQVESARRHCSISSEMQWHVVLTEAREVASHKDMNLYLSTSRENQWEPDLLEPSPRDMKQASVSDLTYFAVTRNFWYM